MMKPILEKVLVLGLLGLFCGAAYATVDSAPRDCNDALSIEAVRGRYARVLRSTRSAEGVLGEIGIPKRIIKAIVKAAFLSDASEKATAEKVLAIRTVKSPPGVPDGDEIQPNTLVALAFLSQRSGRDVHDVFQHLLDFIPLLKDKAVDATSMDALLTLSVYYGLTPKQMVAKVEEFDLASRALETELKSLAENELARVDPLLRALVEMVGAASGRLPNAIAFAAVEASLAAQVSIDVSMDAIRSLLRHERAIRFSLHDQAAMLKAHVVLGLSLDEAVARLEQLDEGAKTRFGDSLAKEMEGPAAHLALLGDKEPSAILDMLEHMVQVGKQYNRAAATLVMNRAVVDVLAEAPQRSILESTLPLPTSED